MHTLELFLSNLIRNLRRGDRIPRTFVVGNVKKLYVRLRHGKPVEKPRNKTCRLRAYYDDSSRSEQLTQTLWGSVVAFLSSTG